MVSKRQELWCSECGVQKTGALVFHEWCPKDRSSGVPSVVSKRQELWCLFHEWCPKDSSSGVCSMSGVQKTGALVFVPRVVSKRRELWCLFHEWCPKDTCLVTALKCCCVLHRYVATIFSYDELLCITAAIHLPDKETSPPKTMCGCACEGVTKNGYNSLTPVSYTHLRAHETAIDLV